MASLLTDDDFAEIREILHDVTDTFLKKPIVWRRDKNTVTRMSRDNHMKRNYTEFNCLGLVVWQNTDSDKAQFMYSKNGKLDMSEGYVLFNLDDLQALQLIDANLQPLGNTEQDSLVFDTIEHDIMGINILGQLKDKEVLVKVHVNKEPRNEKG